MYFNNNINKENKKKIKNSFVNDGLESLSQMSPLNKQSTTNKSPLGFPGKSPSKNGPNFDIANSVENEFHELEKFDLKVPNVISNELEREETSLKDRSLFGRTKIDNAEYVLESRSQDISLLYPSQEKSKFDENRDPNVAFKKYCDEWQESNSDIFGLGGFGELFITDEEIEQAKKKLGDSEAKSADETLQELINTLSSWKVMPNSSSSLGSGLSVEICVNYFVLGRGMISTHETLLQWEGYIGLSCDFSRFKWRKDDLSDVRIKHISENEAYLLMTVESHIFIQFKLLDVRDIGHLSEMSQKLKRPISSPDIQAKKVNQYAKLDEEARQLIEMAEEKYNRAVEHAKSQLDKARHDIMAELLKKKAELHLESSSENTELNSNECNGDCPLCFTSDWTKSYSLEPCGHWVCLECKDRMVENKIDKCPWERFEITGFSLRNP